jgi:hypothetical protein
MNCIKTVPNVLDVTEANSSTLEAFPTTYQDAYSVPPTYDEILAKWLIFTDEQRSLAWSPKPPHDSRPSDCRRGGACGLDYNSPRSRWVIARFRWSREQEQLGGAA